MSLTVVHFTNETVGFLLLLLFEVLSFIVELVFLYILDTNLLLDNTKFPPTPKLTYFLNRDFYFLKRGGSLTFHEIKFVKFSSKGLSI